MNASVPKQPSIRRKLYQRAVIDSFIKLDPRVQVRNPVMFVVEVGSVLTTGLWIQALIGHGEAPAGFIGAVAIWLWFTVLFANFSEALAEGRGKAQAEALRRPARRPAPRSCPKRLPKACDPDHFDTVPSTAAAPGRHLPGRGRRHHPRGWRGRRRHRLGGRIAVTGESRR